MNRSIPYAPPFTLYFGELGATMAICDLELRCPECRRMKMRFVNRDGRTVCCECDLPRQQQHELREWFLEIQAVAAAGGS